MAQRVKIAAAVAALAVLSLGIGLATAMPPRVSADAATAISAGAAQVSTSAAPSGVMLAEANGKQVSARVVATGVNVRALAANAYSVPVAATTAGNKTQDAMLLLTSSAEANRVEEIAQSLFFAFAGTGAAGSLGDGGAATAAQFNLKTDSLIDRSGVAIAADGTVFIADTGNSTIRRIASSAAGASTEPGIVRSIAGRWAPAQNVSLVEPLGLAIDRAGNLYIADRGANAVLELPKADSETPGELEVLAHVAAPSSLGVTQDGSKVFVATTVTGAIYAVDTARKTVAAVGAFTGSPDACASAGTNTAASAATPASTKICPAGLAVDPRGNLFISDANSNEVLRVNAADGKVVTVASNLRSPGALAADANGNLYVADQLRAQIVFAAADPAQACVTGPSGVLQLCPEESDFGSVVQGGITSTTPFILTNTSNSDVSNLVYSPALPPITPPVQPPSSPFIVQTTSCVTTIAANSSCTLNVTFSPNATGQIGGALTVSDANPQDTVTSTLDGSGTNFQLQLASMQGQSVTVVAGTTAVYNFTLVPDANYPYTGAVTIVCPPSYNPLTTSNTNNLPLLAYCVPPSSPVMLTPGQNTNFTVSIETTSRAGVTSSSHMFPALPGFDGPHQPGTASLAVVLAAWILLAAAALAFLAFSPRGTKFRAAFAILALMALGGAIAGCGGHKLTVDGTPAGTSVLLFQATAEGTARSFTVNLVVD
ncbi:MAG TPA: hypothetical protein VMJ93_16035 [Verrucomicrobiae bacterium]|nr:hypothetical protein [Verrucomicrobiae bacterium]